MFSKTEEPEPRKFLIEAYQFEDTKKSERRTPGDIVFPLADNNALGDDDAMMKVKLFRMMYESVKDCDMKVKKAEALKSYYSNMSSFEIGYLLGDVTDKFNVMTDIALTLKRLYHSWKPIEHVNAYEQIANQGIEISHLIEIMRSVAKKNSTRMKLRRGLHHYDYDYD